jgi:hypothetical protein
VTRKLSDGRAFLFVYQLIHFARIVERLENPSRSLTRAKVLLKKRGLAHAG